MKTMTISFFSLKATKFEKRAFIKRGDGHGFSPIFTVEFA